MQQDLLVTLQQKVLGLAGPLRPFRPILRPIQRLGRRAFDRIIELRYPPGSLIAAYQNGRVWRLAPEVALRGPHQGEDVIVLFREFVRPGMQVIDVGANVGQMSLELAELVGPEGRVVSIEPAAGNLALLRAHLQANGMAARTEVVEAACADVHGGFVEFFIIGENLDAVGSGHSTFDRAGGDVRTRPIQVPRVSIDGLCDERRLRPGLIKIDVEGGEIQVLQGAARTLTSARPIIILGFHPFAFPNVVEASDRIRGFVDQHRYRFLGPPSGPLELAEYVARPVEP